MQCLEVLHGKLFFWKAKLLLNNGIICLLEIPFLQKSNVCGLSSNENLSQNLNDQTLWFSGFGKLHIPGIMHDSNSTLILRLKTSAPARIIYIFLLWIRI